MHLITIRNGNFFFLFLRNKFERVSKQLIDFSQNAFLQRLSEEALRRAERPKHMEMTSQGDIVGDQLQITFR